MSSTRLTAKRRLHAFERADLAVAERTALDGAKTIQRGLGPPVPPQSR